MEHSESKRETHAKDLFFIVMKKEINVCVSIAGKLPQTTPSAPSQR